MTLMLDYETIGGLPDSIDPTGDRLPRRVAIFAEAFLPKIDGVSRSALLTLRYLRGTGRDVAIFAPSTSISQIDGIAVQRLPSIPLPFYPEVQVTVPMPPALIRTIDQVRRFRPDVIHLFSPAMLGMYGMIAGAVLRIPVVANYQTDLPGYMHTYGFKALHTATIAGLRSLHNACTLTLAPSPIIRSQLHQRGFQRVRVWERGVDLIRFDPAHHQPAWRNRLLAGRDPARSIVLYVGRLAHDKHLPTLLHLAHNPNLALTIIGDGPIRAVLEAQFAGTDTRFMGALYGDDLANAYAAADLFAFPGSEETFGQVVLEAMASGLPVIVPDQGGAQTLVRHGENGFICPTDHGESFATCAAHLHADPDWRQRIGHSARETAAQRPWLSIMQRLDRYYDEAITRHAVRDAVLQRQSISPVRARRKQVDGRRTTRWQADRAG